MSASENKINSKMLTLARESRGFSQKELADKIGISAAKLCQVEQENQSLSKEALSNITLLLGYPESFFRQEGEAYMPMSLNYRKRNHVAQKLLQPIEAEINIYRLHTELLTAKMKLPVPKIPVFDLHKEKDVEAAAKAAAKEIRKLWKVPEGAIKNMVELLENNGITVFSFNFGTDRVDSRTILTNDKRPLIVFNKSLLGDRERFSLAYELGHLVLHTFTIPSFMRDISHEANVFAAELLMPEKSIRKDFEQDITLPLLGELKQKWKVSMQALLYRASDLEFLTDNQKRYLLEQFNTLKIRRREPPELDIPKETPRLFYKQMLKYKDAQGFSVKEIAALFHLKTEDFMARYA